MGGSIKGILGNLLDPLGLFTGGQQEQAPMAPPPVAPTTPENIQASDPQQAADAQRKRAALQGGRTSTVKTSPLGLLENNTAAPTLLGS